VVAVLAGGWFLFHQETAPVVIATTQPTHTTQSAQSTQSTESAQSIQSAQSTESAQSTHSAQPPETAQSKEKAADESSLPAADLSSTQDHNFAQKLFKEHLWRHRTAKFVELPDDRYPRMGSLSTAAVKTISDMNAVIKVDLSGFKDTAYLIDLKSTTLLDLNLATTDVSDTTVEHFGTNLPNLQKLELGDSQQLKAFSLKSRSLKSLDLSATNISDAVLKSLRTPNLQDLSLRNCKKLTDTGFASLANLGSLRKLNVNETSISDSSIGHLSSLPHLEELTLGKYSNLTDHCLVEIAKLPHLTHLNMRGIDPKGKLSLLRKLPNLQWLGLASTTLTDEDLADIAQLPQLKEVDLTKASFSDKGYSKLVENTPHLVKLRNAPDEDLDPQAENIRSHRKLKQIPPSY
jgi:hypothetical protein